MRRRRVLRVDTFPFLAVLLCTMGSLILILMVVDRRARIVAQARLLKRATQIVEEEAEVARAHKLEFERRRQALHAALEGELQQLYQRASEVERQKAMSAEEIAKTEAEWRRLQSQLQVEQGDLSRRESEIRGLQQKLNDDKQQSQAKNAQLARLAADLD